MYIYIYIILYWILTWNVAIVAVFQPRLLLGGVVISPPWCQPSL